MPWITREMVVDARSPHVGGRLDRLVQEIAGGARSHVAGLFDHDCVTLNSEVTREMWRRLNAGDRVHVRWEAGQRYHAKPRPRPHRGFAVVYEDPSLIVVDKSPELLTVPTEKNEPYTLVYRVNEYVRRSKTGRGAFSVHRLDRGVSGLLVFGKQKEIADSIRDQFAARKPERKYVAIVVGSLQPDEGTFRSYLATDKSLKRFSTTDQEIGQYAVTHFRVMERFAGTTLVQVWLETGRRNQIRVHFAEAGHPVLGDARYGKEPVRDDGWAHKRIALHAQSLGLTHPVTGESLRFESQLPREMIEFILQARVRQSVGSRSNKKQRRR